MLEACHERVQRSLDLLQRLTGYLHPCVRRLGPPGRARRTALLRHRGLLLLTMRTKSSCLPLLERGTAEVAAIVRQLQGDHVRMEAHWQAGARALTLAQGELSAGAHRTKPCWPSCAGLRRPYPQRGRGGLPGGPGLLEPQALQAMGRGNAPTPGCHGVVAIEYVADCACGWGAGACFIKKKRGPQCTTTGFCARPVYRSRCLPPPPWVGASRCQASIYSWNISAQGRRGTPPCPNVCPRSKPWRASCGGGGAVSCRAGASVAMASGSICTTKGFRVVEHVHGMDLPGLSPCQMAAVAASSKACASTEPSIP